MLSIVVIVPNVRLPSLVIHFYSHFAQWNYRRKTESLQHAENMWYNKLRNEATWIAIKIRMIIE